MSSTPPTPKRRIRWYPNINTRIVVPFLLIVVMIAAVGVFITTRLVVSSIQERFTNQLADSASTASSGFVDLQNQMLASLRLMAFTEGVTAAISTQNTSALETLLRPVAGSSSFEQVIVFDLTGHALVDLNSLPATKAVSDAEVPGWAIVQAILAKQTDTSGDKFAAFIEHPPAVSFFVAAPITDTAGNLVGGVTAGITVESLLTRLSQQSLSGLILYNTVGTVWGSTFSTPDGSNANVQLPAEQFRALLNAVQQSSPLEEFNIGDRQYQVLFTPLRVRSQLVGLLASALPSNFIVERSATTRTVFVVLFVGLFISVLMVGIAIAQTITRPVQQLVATTRAIRGGDLSRRVRLNLPDELGELAVSFDDMTEQLVQRNQEIGQLYEDQLRKNAQLDAIILSISDALFMINSAGHVVLRNRNAQELIEKLAKNRELYTKLSVLIREIVDPMPPQTVTLGTRSYRAQATQVSTASGEQLGSVITLQDITALIETERIKDDLVKQMSHELRTPLTAIRGYVELVKLHEQATLSDAAQSFIDQALNNLSVMGRMVDEVVEVSSIVSNHFELNRTTFDFSTLLENLAATWAPRCSTRGLELHIANPGSLVIQADQERLTQALDHILRNAYSYTLPGGQIDVQAAVDTTSLIVRVADQGVGIDEDELELVFERMYRGRSAGAGPTDARGLGLGLYLSKMIIMAHGGTIHLDSQRDCGTVVTIQIPVEMAHHG